MGITTDEFVNAFVAEVEGKQGDLDRLVTEPSGLNIAGMIEAMYHPSVGRLAIPLLADFMAPEGSIYYDAIFGAYYGQSSIRRWLVPAMADIEFIDFVPTAETVVIDDGHGGTWLDEWQMVMNLEGEKMPLARGVSVRRYRDGWLNWACDVYDTAAFRQPAPPGVDVSAAPELPPCPHVEWQMVMNLEGEKMPLARGVSVRRFRDGWLNWACDVYDTAAFRQPAPPGVDVSAAPELPPCPHVEWQTDAAGGQPPMLDPRRTAGPFHPTESVYFDPIAGELHGGAAIAAWIDSASADAAGMVFEPLGPVLTDGHTTVQEWKRTNVDEGVDGSLLRGTSVRRAVDGLTVYAADYYDTAVLAHSDP